jgi:hypothetical protein
MPFIPFAVRLVPCAFFYGPVLGQARLAAGLEIALI